MKIQLFRRWGSIVRVSNTGKTGDFLVPVPFSGARLPFQHPLGLQPGGARTSQGEPEGQAGEVTMRH